MKEVRTFAMNRNNGNAALAVKERSRSHPPHSLLQVVRRLSLARQRFPYTLLALPPTCPLAFAVMHISELIANKVMLDCI